MAEQHATELTTARRVSALADVYQAGHYGRAEQTGVFFELLPGSDIQQIAAWPDTMVSLPEALASELDGMRFPGPGEVVAREEVALLRVEPLKWWLVNAAVSTPSAELGTVLDISHSRTHLLITGDAATTLLNRFLPVDLRLTTFPENRVLTTGFHHCSVTLWHSSRGYELFLPRAFAVSLFELLCESALQFGYELR